MKYFIVNRRKRLAFVAFTAFVFLFAAESLTMAQATLRKYKPGDKIDMGRGVTYEIVECRVKPNTGEEECDFIAFFKDGSASNLNTALITGLRRDEQLVKAEKKRLEVINGRGKTDNQPSSSVESDSRENQSEIQTPANNAELTVTAQQFYAEYNNNDAAAKRKYVGKTVRVTGAIVYNISEASFSARFSKTYTGSTIQCYVEDIEQIATLNKGETLTLVGTPLGSLTSTGVILEPCRIERKNSNQTAKSPAQKTPVSSPLKNTGGKTVGTWYYTAIIKADGTEQKLNNSASYLWLKEDGSYENRFGGAYGQIGTFAANGSRLTLNREDGDKKVYTMTISGETMTLKSGAGGYKLVRE